MVEAACGNRNAMEMKLDASISPTFSLKPRVEDRCAIPGIERILSGECLALSIKTRSARLKAYIFCAYCDFSERM